jgi:hypothetical protein
MGRLTFLLFLGALALPAQTRVEARGTFGGAWFLDEDPVDHYLVGGSARFYLTRRLSLEPEFLYLRKDRTDQDWIVQPNLAFDLRPPESRVTPYVIGGVGLLRTRMLVGTGYFTSQEATVSGGFGAKIFLSRRWFFSPEVRVGHEPIFRVTASLGYLISR